MSTLKSTFFNYFLHTKKSGGFKFNYNSLLTDKNKKNFERSKIIVDKNC